MDEPDRLMREELAAFLESMPTVPAHEEYRLPTPRLFTIEPPPPPRTLEVGWLAHARLRLLARQPNGPIAHRYGEWGLVETLTGIPVVERKDLAADAWRLMEGDNVIKEGAL